MKTSKSKYRTAADFDLQRYTLLFPLLEAVPHDERVGAIVKGEQGLPIRERSYRKWFRQIARAAGIPDTIWSMDSRAGGATEAEEAGAALDAIQGALTHSKKDTTLRYIRQHGQDRDGRRGAQPQPRERSGTGLKCHENNVRTRRQNPSEPFFGKLQEIKELAGRGSRIRTCDLQYPKLPRYQAALYPARRVVGYMFRRPPASGEAAIADP